MSKKTIMVVTEIMIEQQPRLTFEELCVACQVNAEFIEDLIDFGILELDGGEFTADHLRRVRAVQRLQNDLEVNLAGAAVILDLIDEVEELRQRLEIYEK